MWNFPLKIEFCIVSEGRRPFWAIKLFQYFWAIKLFQYFYFDMEWQHLWPFSLASFKCSERWLFSYIFGGWGLLQTNAHPACKLKLWFVAKRIPIMHWRNDSIIIIHMLKIFFLKLAISNYIDLVNYNIMLEIQKKTNT